MAEGHAGGAYAKLERTPNYVGEALTNLGNVAFRDRQFKQEQADKVQAQKAAQAKSDLDTRQKEIDDLDKLNKEHPLIKTGQEKIDNPNLRSAFEFKKVYADARANYLKTGNPDDVAKYQNALSSLDGLSKLPEMYNTFSADLIKGSAEGLYNTNSAEKKAKILDLFQKGNYTYSPDKNGNALISVYDTDENGKVSNIVANQLSGEQLLQQMKPIQSFNYNGESGQKGSQSFIENFKQSLGTEQEVYKNGKITKEYPNGQALAEKATEDLLKNDSQVYQMAILSGIEPRDKVSEYKPKELQLIKQKVEKDLIDRLPKSERPDYEAQRIALEKEKEARRIKEKANDDAKENPKFGLISVSASKNPQVLGDVKAPVGTKKISYSGLINGDPKKSYQQMTDIAVVKTKKGFVVTGKVKSFGGESVSTKETKYKQSYYDKVKWLNTHPKATDAQKENYQPDETDILSETTTQKQVPAKYLRFGTNAPEVAEFLKGANMTVTELQRQAIIDAGYNPDEKFNSDKTEKTEKIKLGAVIDGYKFLGGDPNNSKSWKKI